MFAPDAQLRERELVLGVAYSLLRFTPRAVDADEAEVLLDVTVSLRLFHDIRGYCQVVARGAAYAGA
ncbi:hypothetical protein [Burkholderia plantarii]|uniref:hypothetical protein n=1 Tax=Burkholderia plantarii TaxID=41899 RepID=UPI00272BA81E|nr:hypothetical protein [Burkholderia plantarii]